MTSRPSPDPTALAAVLRSSDVFGWLSEDQCGLLASCMSFVSLADGEVLIEQDQAPEKLYVVLIGVLDITSADRHGSRHALGPVGAGTVLGELALFSAPPAMATARARGPAQLAELGKSAFEHFSRRCPAGALQLMDALRPRLHRHQLRVALQRSDMFGPMDPIALLDLESEFELVALYGGEVLFTQGDIADSLYFVISGRLRVVSVAADGTETLLAELGTGETVGEMAVLSGEPRSATVCAIRDTQLAKLSKTSVGRVVGKHPQAMLLMLTGRLISRVRNMSTGEPRRPSLSTIAVVPASRDVPLIEFAGRLAAAMATLGRTLHLTSGIVDDGLGRTGAAQAHDREGGGSGLLEWLTEMEAAYRYVVYQSDPGLSPWTERCVRQADRVILVANAAGDADAGEIEAEIVNRRPAAGASVTLALLHDDRTAVPSGTMRWLAPRVVERHLHVRRTASADYDRLARFLTGGAVGLALGGGFARGLAHLGVFRALDELGIPIDAVGGSSMGALIGAQRVIGRDPSRIVQEIQRGFADSFDDMTLPFLSFKRGGRISTFVRQMFQDVRIEDLWTPFFCVSANLNRAELKVHTSGSLADAILASSRAPGILPPMVIDGELHVDGGVINNVPVDVMKTFCNNGLVIGVDVSPPHELNPVADYGEDIPGWKAIWNRFNPTRENRIYRPSILLVLMRVIEFGGISYRRQKAEAADVYISPEIVRFKRNDFHAAADIIETGYRASSKRLEEWLHAAPAAVRSRRPDLFNRVSRIHLTLIVGALLGMGCSTARSDATAREWPAWFEECVLDGTGERARCGTVRVAESAAAPSGRQIDLRVVVLPAIGSPAAPDPIVPLAGGPGQGAADLARPLAERFAQFRGTRDLVLVDQRGTGQSNGLHCAAPEHVRDVMGRIFDADRLARCRDELAARADLTQYTTAIAAGDYERVFDALGYRQVNLVGTSYGSRMALELARRFPLRVRSITLDAVVPTAFDWPAQGAADADAALGAVVDDCRADRACRTAFPRFQQDIDLAFARLMRTPVTATVRDPASGAVERVPFAATDLAYATRGLLYGNEALWLPAMFRQAAENAYDAFAQAYVTRARTLERQLARGVHLGVYCAEDLPFLDVAHAEKAAEGTRLGRYLLDQYRGACDVWPRAPIPAAFRDPVQTAVPALLLAGRRDPVTPPRTAVQAARTLARSRVLIWPYGGHGTDGLTSGDCRANVLRAFMTSANPEGLPLECVSQHPRLPFRNTGQSQ